MESIQRGRSCFLHSSKEKKLIPYSRHYRLRKGDSSVMQFSILVYQSLLIFQGREGKQGNRSDNLIMSKVPLFSESRARSGRQTLTSWASLSQRRVTKISCSCVSRALEARWDSTALLLLIASTDHVDNSSNSASSRHLRCSWWTRVSRNSSNTLSGILCAAS